MDVSFALILSDRLTLSLFPYNRTRSVYNYVGSIIAFGVFTLASPDPSLAIRLMGQIGNIVGSQLVALGFMLIPKLFVRVSLNVRVAMKKLTA